jgi:hypothetical protein
MTPIMTVTAAATDRTMTSRILLVVAVPERTAQRSHRGYRPASQMASCNHYDRHLRRVTARRNRANCARTTANAAGQAFFIYIRHWVEASGVTGDTLCA